MRGIISGIKRMEVHDGDGLRTTVFFKGCPLRCVWCHNPESISHKVQVAFFKEKCILCGMCNNEKSVKTEKTCPVNAIVTYGEEYDDERLVEEICIDKPFWGERGGITLSGGECLFQPNFAVSVAKRLHERGVSVYVDTCGYTDRTVLDKIIPYTDKFLYDIKAIDADVHKRCTGKDNKQILENLLYLSEKGCRIEIRYPLVKGYNDGECESIAKFLSGVRGITAVKVLKYHSFSASRYEALNMKKTLPNTETTSEDVEKAIEIFSRYGISVLI